jgi:adenylate cyclase
VVPALSGYRRSRVVVFAAAGLIGLACGVLSFATGAMHRIELATIDARFDLRGDRSPPDDIVLVLIDDKTFDRLDEQWPFPRSLHAAVIDRLTQAGASAIAYDVQFTEPSSPNEDRALIQSVGRAGRMTMATEEVDSRGHSDVFGGDPVLRRLGARAGDTQFGEDSDGVIRRLPYAVRGLEGFAVVAQEQRTGHEVSRSDFPSDGGAWIDFRGPEGTFPAVSFSDVLTGDFAPGTFAGKTVVVGAGSPSLHDIHATAASPVMSGPELQANAIATVAAGLPLREAPAWLSLVLIGLAALAVPATSIRVRSLLSLVSAVAITIVLLVGGQLAFDRGLILPVVDPVLALAVATMAVLGAQYFLAAVERVRMRDAFARFVPASVIDEALEGANDDLRLKGVKRDATVLFADMRAFTTMSERLEPEVVIEVLNRYLTAISDAIMSRGGTLVAFMGDGVMAVFGAPLDQHDHARNAVASALEIVDACLADFNAWLRDRDIVDEPARVAVGIHSGPVMSGTVGSQTRLEYAAVGDTTNIASRLEEAAKQTDAAVLISAATRELAGDVAEAFRPAGEIRVRGRAAVVEAWRFDSGGKPE